MPIDLRPLARRLIPRRVRNWLRSPLRSLAWVRDGLLHRLGRDVIVELRPGWRLTAHPAAWRTAYRLHTVDPEQIAELDGFIRECRQPMLLFDIGAHFGLFSLAALHYGGPQARAVAVDPSPVAIGMLRRVALQNDLADRLTAMEAAAAAESGQVSLIDVGVQAAGYFVPADDAHPTGERTSVQAVTIDALARRFGLPTHLKIDVEGFEADVLQGARAVLGAAVPPTLFLELHHLLVRERGLDPAGAIELVSSLGYGFFDGSGQATDGSALLGRDLVRVIARPGNR